MFCSFYWIAISSYLIVKEPLYSILINEFFNLAKLTFPFLIYFRFLFLSFTCICFIASKYFDIFI